MEKLCEELPQTQDQIPHQILQDHNVLIWTSPLGWVASEFSSSNWFRLRLACKHSLRTPAEASGTFSRKSDSWAVVKRR